MLELLDPRYVMPLVAILVGRDCQETGSVFEAGGGHMAKYKWERSKGAILVRDDNLSAGALLQRWNEVVDFQEPEYPEGPMDLTDLTNRLKSAPSNPKAQDLDFTGRVVMVTGGGGG